MEEKHTISDVSPLDMILHTYDINASYKMKGNLTFGCIHLRCPICGYIDTYYLNYDHPEFVNKDNLIFSDEILSDLCDGKKCASLTDGHILHDKNNLHNRSEDFDTEKYRVFMRAVDVELFDDNPPKFHTH